MLAQAAFSLNAGALEPPGVERDRAPLLEAFAHDAKNSFRRATAPGDHCVKHIKGNNLESAIGKVDGRTARFPDWISDGH